MIDPILSLAFSIHANKSVYALLLGSGVSRSAGVPTGWEVVLDLIRKLAHVKGEDSEPDPTAWYTQAFGKEPDYAELLDELVKSSPERSRLLRAYFEPTDEERERGAKVPSEAHKAIASLVAKGYVRVILTTNFDRLLEEALAGEGVVPTVISTPDAAEGAIPLIHSNCTIVKLHGDYLDTRIKNTPKELAAYDEKINAIIDRVFDEFGIVVCGWSAEWDAALRAALERCKSRRYSTYWAARSEPKGTVKRLIDLRRAEVVSIKTADAFFRQIRENVLALESFDHPHPLSAKVAVANLERYISDDRYMILLRGLVMEETERVYTKIIGPDLPIRSAAPDAATIPARATYYEAITDTLLQLLIRGCYWGEQRHESLWIECIERLANPERGGESYVAWLEMKRYPALLLLYGGGIAALASSRYETVMGLLTRACINEDGKDLPAVSKLNPFKIMNLDIGQSLPGMERHYTPLSDHLRRHLFPKLKDFAPREDQFERLLDRFEYVLALAYLDYRVKEGLRVWVPVGRFGWRFRDNGRGIAVEIGAEIEQFGGKWPLLMAGLCGGSLEQLRSVKSSLDEFVKELRWDG